MTAPINRVLLMLLFGSLLAAAGSGSLMAHHGGGVEYHMDQTLGPVAGVVTRFNFSFPHPQVYFDHTDENGEVTPWVAVMRLSPVGLRQRGWTRNSMMPGDTISVVYSPHRTAPNVGFARRIEVNGEFLDEGM
jgi:hypothetical protein